MEWRKIHLDLPTFPNIDFAILRMETRTNTQAWQNNFKKSSVMVEVITESNCYQMEGAGWFPSKTIFESDKSKKSTYYATQLQSDFKRRSQETNDQLTVRLKAALDFFP